MMDKKNIGQSTKSIWSGEQEHELYENSTQVPVVHLDTFKDYKYLTINYE